MRNWKGILRKNWESLFYKPMRRFLKKYYSICWKNTRRTKYWLSFMLKEQSMRTKLNLIWISIYPKVTNRLGQMSQMKLSRWMRRTKLLKKRKKIIYSLQLCSIIIIIEGIILSWNSLTVTYPNLNSQLYPIRWELYKNNCKNTDFR